MGQLIKIANWTGKKRGNVVFVHGLGGHPYDTWQRGADDKTFWPLWLAEDVPGLAVFSYAYASPPSNWLGTAMPLLDEAAHALRVLLLDDDLDTGPITFVCHSQGGLIVKQMLRNAADSRDPRSERFLSRVRLVVFIATPHTGSGKANLLRHLAFLAWPSPAASDLVANQPGLRDLNIKYRSLAEHRQGQLAHLVYYEMSDTLAGRIVVEDSADPGLPACTPMPVNADHILIAKPGGRDELLYKETKKSIEELSPKQKTTGELVIYSRTPFQVARSWQQWMPRIIRLIILALILGVVVWSVIKPDPPPPDEKHLQQQLIEQLAKELAKQIAASSPVALTEEQKKTAEENAVRQIEIAAADLARRNDQRSQEAFAALQRGSTSEAEALFDAIYQDNIRAGNNAAAAWALRHRAALVQLTNVAEAVKLYAKVAALQPADYANWTDLGYMAILAGQYPQAQQAFEQALGLAQTNSARAPNDLGWQRKRYESQLFIGDSLLDQGKDKEALERYESALQIADSLAQAAPDDRGFKRDVLVALGKSGRIYMDAGSFSAALANYQRSLGLARELESANNPFSRRDLGVALIEVGNAHRRLGNAIASDTTHRPLANKAYTEAINKVLFPLVRDYPNKDSNFQANLSFAYLNMGQLLADQKNWVEAIKYYQAALDTIKPLADADPTNIVHLSNVLDIQGYIGDSLLGQRKVQEALTKYQEEISTGELLQKSGQASANQLRQLSTSYYWIGEIKRCQGDINGALASYQQSLALVQHLDQTRQWQPASDFSRQRISSLQAGQQVSCEGLTEIQPFYGYPSVKAPTNTQ
ncbi:MAG: hypothetical protein LBE62_02610 [Azonexus sp.]|jgi:tetratricopeptide (TPR) repeat protein/pimeloyl-ACP methyl ester carboxylesterase|nr:hypothetical protein [Azonexus sp.]